MYMYLFQELKKKHKDPVQLQRELDKLHPKYVQRLVSNINGALPRISKGDDNSTFGDRC